MTNEELFEHVKRLQERVDSLEDVLGVKSYWDKIYKTFFFKKTIMRPLKGKLHYQDLLRHAKTYKKRLSKKT